MIRTMNLSSNEDDWRDAFGAERLDVIPDPMVMRAADLFIGGKSFAKQAGLDPGEAWKVIQLNLDGLIAFFHMLMTRDRIPLIDYEYTFAQTNFDALGEIAVAIHPPNYQDLKEKAKLKLSTIDLDRIPEDRRVALARGKSEELKEFGYNWFPDPGDRFSGSDKVLASLLLAGLIFGGYAQISGSDHVLQTSRNMLLLELTQSDDDAPLWGPREEAKLFTRLNAVVSRDPRLSSLEVQLPPTVLPSLVREQPKSPRHLFEKALELRENDKNFIAYRIWHKQLRETWAIGAHNDELEKDVVDVCKELTKRYPPGKDPVDTPAVWSREIGLKVGAELGVEADLGKVTVSFPNWVRNWLVEGIRFRSHRKILLQLALAQLNSNYLLKGLKRLWFA